MASPNPSDDDPSDDYLFEKTHISLTVSVDDAPGFVLEHGFFYQGDKDVADLVAKLDGEALKPSAAHEFKTLLSKYPVSMIGNGSRNVINAV